MLILCTHHAYGRSTLLPPQGHVHYAMHVESSIRGMSEAFPAQVS